MLSPPPWRPRASRIHNVQLNSSHHPAARRTRNQVLSHQPFLLLLALALFVTSAPRAAVATKRDLALLRDDDISNRFILTYRPRPMCDSSCVATILRAIPTTQVRHRDPAGCFISAHKPHLYMMFVTCEAARDAVTALHVQASLRRIPDVTSVSRDAVVSAGLTDSRDRRSGDELRAPHAAGRGGAPPPPPAKKEKTEDGDIGGSAVARTILRRSPPKGPILRNNGKKSSPPRNWGLARMAGEDVDLSCYPKRGTGAHVFVIDTGCRTSHKVFDGVDVTAIPAQDSQYESGEDDNGHGTHVAGIVAGVQGVGVAPGASVTCIKAFDKRGRGAATDVISAMEYVLEKREEDRLSPFIVNLSYTSLTGLSDTALDAIVYAASGSGVVVVTAAGNAGVNACLFSPSKAKQALTVTASTRGDTLEGDSNIGPCVEFVAPGHEIVSAGAGGDKKYEPRSGTSMAAPHVAGLAALILAENDGLQLSPATVRDHLYHRMINGNSASVATFIMPLLQVECGGINRKARPAMKSKQKPPPITKAEQELLERMSPPPSPSPSQSVQPEPTPQLFPPDEPCVKETPEPWFEDGGTGVDYWEHARREHLEKDFVDADDDVATLGLA